MRRRPAPSWTTTTAAAAAAAKDRRHRRSPPTLVALLVFLLSLGLLVVRTADAAKAPLPRTSMSTSTSTSSSSHKRSKAKKSMAATATATRPEPTAPPSSAPSPTPSSSAAAQARLLELDRICERLARRLRAAEDRLYPIPTQAEAEAVGAEAAGSEAQQQQSQQQRRPPRVVFSDLDGTLLHFGGALLEEGYEVLEGGLPKGFEPLAPPVIRAHDPEAPPPQYAVLRYKPDGTRRVCIALPSLTSGPGYISVATLRLVHAIRTLGGCDFVLITGARSSTYLMRRRIGLPVADYEVIEGGGRLVRDPDGRLDALLAQVGKGGHDAADEHGPAWDAHWREAIGPVSALRSLRAELEAGGWAVDGRDYLTNFRLDTHAKGKTPQQWEALKARLPSLGLASSFNLGKADIYPATSGKAPAVARLMRRLHADPRECVALFDDDNDLGMAALCAPGRRIAVSITHDSVRQLVASDPGVETGGARPGILATEEALRRVLASLLPGGEAAVARLMEGWVL